MKRTIFARIVVLYKHIISMTIKVHWSQKWFSRDTNHTAQQENILMILFCFDCINSQTLYVFINSWTLSVTLQQAHGGQVLVTNKNYPAEAKKVTRYQRFWPLARPETCENWLGLVNSCVYYACLIRETTRYCLIQWILKLPRSFEFHWVRRYLVNLGLFVIKDL